MPATPNLATELLDVVEGADMALTEQRVATFRKTAAHA
jgi:hypothetical protein